MNDQTVYLVHCVDTEGPLYEPLQVTFDRLASTFGIERPATPDNLSQLRRGEGVDPAIRATVMEFLSAGRLNYHTTWHEIELMLDDMLSDAWRRRCEDDFGRGYVFNWFVMDHVGFTANPRRRALGYHSVFEFYKARLAEPACGQDELHWHFHPVSFTREAHKCSNSYSFTNEHLQVLTRRVLDHQWFPAAFRPGQHTERPDINLFLEQWIPFDYGNQGIDDPEQLAVLNRQRDIGYGRFGDWRRATSEWEVYHPDFYDYQVKGQMKRCIARCLNLNARLREVNPAEVAKAFARAASGLPTILAVTNHDEREMRPSIEQFYALVRATQRAYPGVRIKNAGAVEAMRDALGLPAAAPLKFNVTFQGNVMDVRTNKPCWGPQPFFCFRTRMKEYIHENLDYHGGCHWSYVFDENSIELARLECLGLATNDECGNTTVWTHSLTA